MLHMLTDFFSAREFFIMILLVFTVLFWLIPQKRQWISFAVTVFLFAYLAYMIVPDSSDDLQLYFWFIDDMRKLGRHQFDYFVSQDDFGWKVYKVSAYYYYFFSKLPLNQHDHWLPAVTIFITYGTSLHAINIVSKKYEVNKLHTYIGVMFFLATYWFYDTASGIRNGLAFAIVFACSITQFIQKKHYLLCVIGYLLAIFMHSGGVLAVILVVITVLTQKLEGKYINWILVFSVFGGMSIINYLSKISENGLIQSLTEKSEHYGENTGLLSYTNYYVNIAVYVVFALMLIYFGTYIKNNYDKKELINFHKYANVTMYFLLGTVIVSIVFGRYVRWILPPLAALIIMIGLQFQKNEIEEKGTSYAYYYATTIERFKYKSRTIVMILLVIFTAVHIWYDFNGSSLIWAHFEHEWREKGLLYDWANTYWR